MNFGTMKAEVRLSLGNMPADDPVWAAQIATWVNRAINNVIVLAIGNAKGDANHFPELQTAWTELTTLNVNYIVTPVDKLAITNVFALDEDAVPDLNRAHGRQLSKKSFEVFEQLRRGTDVEGYPRIWAQRGKRIYFHPTPSASYLTYLILHGLMKEIDLVLDADEPWIDSRWHDAVVNEACWIGALRRGWFEEAAQYKRAVLDDIATTLDATGISQSLEDDPIEVDGAPDQHSVYG